MPIFSPLNPELQLQRRPFWWRFRRCKPRILVVIDGLSYTTSGFGLSRFIEAIAHHPTATLRPTLTLAHLNGHSPTVTIEGTTYSVATGFNFSTATPTVTRNNYDQIWLFGVTSVPIDDAQVQVIADFMNDGGGVFATGDHAALGAGMSSRLPRIRHMRNWNSVNTGGVPMGQESIPLSLNRIDTVVNPGADNIYQFNDQSDSIPQRIYPNYSVTGTNVMDWRATIHPVLRMPGQALTRGPLIGGFSNIGPSGERGTVTFSNDMDVLPDHPHESECFEVSPNENSAALNGTYTEAGMNFPEFPDKTSGGGKVPAEILAYSVSGGRTVNNGGWKPPVRPRMFGAMSAYDGHKANPISGSNRPGRIMCDATWHHFININLDGSGAQLRQGLGSWAGNDFTPSTDLLKIYKYFQNMVSWLQPSNRVWCCLYIIIREAFFRSPVREEFFGFAKIETPSDFINLGITMSSAIDAIAGVGASQELLSSALRETSDGKDIIDIFDPLVSPLGAQELNSITAYVMGHLAQVLIPELSEIEGMGEKAKSHEDAAHDKFEKFAKGSIAKLIKQGAELQLKQITARNKTNQKALKSFIK